MDRLQFRSRLSVVASLTILVFTLGCSTSGTKDQRSLASVAQYENTIEDGEIHQVLTGEDLAYTEYTKSITSSGPISQTNSGQDIDGYWGEAAQLDSPFCEQFDPDSSDPKAFDLRTLVHYRQSALQKSDPFGDYTLINEFLFMIKEKIRRVQGNKHHHLFAIYANQDSENRQRAEACMKLTPSRPLMRTKIEPFDAAFMEVQLRKVQELDHNDVKYLMHEKPISLDGLKNPFKDQQIAKMFVQIMYEESQGKRPITPIIHKNYVKWSPKFLKKYAPQLIGAPFFASKLVIALANGDTGRVLATGREKEMEEWILSQPLRSVMFDGLFRKAYQLHNGDVYLTLLMLENVLSRYRFWPGRDYLEFSNRLGPMLNYVGNDIDLFGPYYHFFGTLLLAYVEGGLKANFAGRFEKLNSLFAKELGDKQEGYANVAGSRVGVHFHRLLKRKAFKNWKNDPTLTDPKIYLDRSEDFTQRIREYWNKNRPSQ